MILILLLHFSYLGIGLTLIRLLFEQDEFPYGLWLVLAYFVGVLFHVIVLHIAIVAMLTSPTISWTLLIFGLLSLVSEVWLTLKAKSIKSEFATGFRIELIVYVGIAVALIPVIYLISLKLVGVPDISYDSTAFWNLKAKYFFYGEHIWTDAFMDIHRVHPHLRYPLYMPIFTFEHYSILGIADDFGSKPGTWIYYGTGMLLFFMLTREWAGTSVALLAVALLLYTPLHSYNSIQGGITSTYVDFPLSIMIMASLGLFLRYLKYGKQTDLFGAMIFVCSAILQKREGSVWFILFMAFALPTMWLTYKRTWKKEFKWFSLPLLVFVSWYFLRVQLPYEPMSFHLPTADDMYKLGEYAPKMLMVWIKSIVNIKGVWGVFGIFVVPAFSLGFLRNLRNVSCLCPALMVPAYLGVIFTIIILLDIQSQNDLWYHFTERPGNLYNRLIIHIHLVGLFLAIIMNSVRFRRGFQVVQFEKGAATDKNNKD